MDVVREHGPVPFATGSVSLRLYPHALEPTALLDELVNQAALAASAGFDGVLLSERHGGAWSQIPNPLQAAGWLLSAMPDGWVAPCPLLLPFRRPVVVAEEIAWLAARFPRRVGVGFGSGGNQADFDYVGVPFDERARRFDENLRIVVGLLRGDRRGEGTADPAIERARREDIPLVSAAMSRTAVRRAAELGLGIIGSSLLSTARTRSNVEEYQHAGGLGPHVVICRAWLGDPPLDLMELQFAEYAHASGDRRVAPAAEGLLVSTDAGDLAAQLVAAATDTAADALNVRVHIAGLDPKVAREQIDIIGREVLPAVRAAWSPGAGPGR
jgi:alkanesulfonate monooxygenase SsuD/methylene tetrahydromethanopterin reductase-like flavin-dependent oxidoreductase (luciferase family)